MCREHKGGGWFKKSDEIRALKGVVYKTNSRGPRTERESQAEVAVSKRLKI